MRRISAFILGFLLLMLGTGGRTHAYERLDSAVRAALDTKLTEYFAALERETLPVQMEECDFLIESSSDSLVRQHVAVRIYDHYLNSPVMGSESVAIHVLDRWFLDGKVKMYNETDLLNARVFADFNRLSLLGCRAPELLLRNRAGEHVKIFPADTSASGGRYAILYFYDTSCAKCRLESIKLRNLFMTEDFPVDIYAVYAGDDPEAWDSYVAERLDFASDTSGKARLMHLWDPELDSDFQRRYGVLQTPRMFLVGPDGTIIGRGLDTDALAIMLHGIFDEVQLEYGSDESMSLYDGIFVSSEGSPTAVEVMDIADHISEVTLEKGDTVMFRQMTGDLLYYLAPQTGEGMKEGTAVMIRKHIFGRPDVWRTADDSLKVVGFALVLDDLLSKAAPGTLIPDLKIPGTLLSARGSASSRRLKSAEGAFRLRRLGGDRNIVLFYTDGCDICKAEKEAAHRLVLENGRRVRVLLVNVDDIVSAYPDMASQLFDSFDLSVLPYIIETDRKSCVSRRYISLY